jgi:hypothetical protein
MDNGYAYGMGPGSLITVTGGPTGIIVEGLKMDAAAGEELEIQNNDAGQTLAQSVMTKFKGTASATAEFKGWVDPLALLGLSATLTAVSANTAAVTATCSITIKTAGSDSNRGNWMFNIGGTVEPAA